MIDDGTLCAAWLEGAQLLHATTAQKLGRRFGGGADSVLSALTSSARCPLMQNTRSAGWGLHARSQFETIGRTLLWIADGSSCLPMLRPTGRAPSESRQTAVVKP